MKWALLVAAAALVALLVLRARRPADRRTRRIDEGGPGPARSGAPSDGELAALLAAFAPAKRTAFDPVTEGSDSDAPVSKLGGVPWLPEGTAWPICPGCGTPMHFFAQLDVGSLPEEAGVGGTGLIQLFLCTATDSRNDLCLQTWEHGSSSAVVRLVDSSQPGASSHEHEGSRTWPPRRIVRWRATDDWPHYEDWEAAGLAISDELEATFDRAEGDGSAPYPLGGDKVGGWPLWVQGAEWGRCGECGSILRLVLQIDSEDNIPYMFGDAGIGHVLQCPNHPARLAWGWACS